MRFLRLPLIAASLSATLTVTGCAARHDLSIDDSCRQWHQLNRLGADEDVVVQDLRDAEPRMHEAVAKQVRIYVDKIGTIADSLDDTRAWMDAYDRLDSICGPNF